MKAQMVTELKKLGLTGVIIDGQQQRSVYTNKPMRGLHAGLVEDDDRALEVRDYIEEVFAVNGHKTIMLRADIAIFSVDGKVEVFHLKEIVGKNHTTQWWVLL